MIERVEVIVSRAMISSTLRTLNNPAPTNNGVGSTEAKEMLFIDHPADVQSDEFVETINSVREAAVVTPGSAVHKELSASAHQADFQYEGFMETFNSTRDTTVKKRCATIKELLSTGHPFRDFQSQGSVKAINSLTEAAVVKGGSTISKELFFSEHRADFQSEGSMMTINTIIKTTVKQRGTKINKELSLLVFQPVDHIETVNSAAAITISEKASRNSDDYSIGKEEKRRNFIEIQRHQSIQSQKNCGKVDQ